MSLYVGFFTKIGRAFGFRNFGKLAGIGLILSAVFSLIQFPIMSLALTQFHSFDFANYGLAFLGILMFAYPLWEYRNEIEIRKRKKLEMNTVVAIT